MFVPAGAKGRMSLSGAESTAGGQGGAPTPVRTLKRSATLLTRKRAACCNARLGGCVGIPDRHRSLRASMSPSGMRPPVVTGEASPLDHAFVCR